MGLSLLASMASPAASFGALITLEQAVLRTAGDFTFNIDVSAWDALGTPLSFAGPGGADFSEFAGNTGLGLITIAVIPTFASGSGSGSVAGFFDLEIDEAENTFFNENAVTTGATGGIDPGSFEVDEPGFVFGDIFDNFVDNNLDNTNSIPPGSEEDVSVAVGWDFTLLAFQTALVTILLSENGEVVIGSTFSVIQGDPDSGGVVTYSGALRIAGQDPGDPGDPGDPVVPEPTTLLLLGAGALGAAAIRRRRR